MKGLKTGGRQRGTPNVLDSTAKEILQQVIDQEIANLPALLESLEAKDRAQLLVKLLPYKYARVEPETFSPTEPIIIHIPPTI
jgi:hypothetical protein